MSTPENSTLSRSIEETRDGTDILDDDSGNFQLDSADSNLTASEDENAVLALSSCTDEVVMSLDTISSSSIDTNVKDSLDGEEICDFNDIGENNGTPSSPLVCSKFTLESRANYKRDGISELSKPSIANKIDSPDSDASKVEDISEVSMLLIETSNEVYKKLHADKEISSTYNKCNADSKNKLKKIISALESGDIEFLRSAAVSRGGLLNDDIRKKVWPKLLGVDLVETSPRPTLKDIESHPYYNQVVLDVNRSLKRFPPSIRESRRLTMLDQLVFLIMRVLCRHPELHYYQGYHDICVTFLLVLGEETAFYVVEKLSQTHLNVFMESNMEPTIHLLEHMYVIIGKKKPLLNCFLLKSEVGIAFCVSWLITWFGHVLNDYNNVVRLFDLFIVSHPFLPMYLTTAVVLHRESEVLKQECEMASIHCLLSNIPDDLPFEDLIQQAIGLYDSYTPKMLTVEHPFIKKSKLKRKKGWSFFTSVTRTIKSAVPAPNITVPIVIAAAVLVTAVLYQAYKY